ncbi:PqqD family protein [Aliiroseovarius sp. S2029]|uniref:PqqD family protein n=1 Tax=Aliiroseovarius sp. S2029 TaxID=2936988 RepID=UPI0020BE6AA8|nr:PqqD family protein [Aliiroseovarius sp. S2029]
MARTNLVTFEGLQAPIAFQDAAPLERLAQVIIPSWPKEAAPDGAPDAPFARLSPAGNDKWLVDIAAEPDGARIWDDVDALCDLISEMAWQRLRAAPELLCLHCAAVAFGPRLVVFPNARRAGKSTLTMALAHLGLTVFTDDFLPVEIEAEDGRLLGIANGIAPRLRLPLPDGFSEAFQTWVAHDPGPANARYKYMTDVPIAEGQRRLPIGAVVVLDRQDSPTAPRLVSASPADVMQVMIRQNFSRDQHAGRILTAVEAVTQTAPLFRLEYSSAEEAADWLARSEKLRDLPEARIAHGVSDELVQSYDRDAAPGQPFDPLAIYARAPGLVETQVEDAFFLADANGQAIHQLNQGSLAIWRILDEPASLDEVVEVMCAAFPQIDPDQIRIDATQCLQLFAQARLIEMARNSMAASQIDQNAQHSGRG